MALDGDGVADGILALDGVGAVGASVGAAAGTIRIMAVIGAGDLPIMAGALEARTLTAVGAGVDGAAGVAITPEQSSLTTAGWLSALLRATGWVHALHAQRLPVRQYPAMRTDAFLHARLRREVAPHRMQEVVHAKPFVQVALRAARAVHAARKALEAVQSAGLQAKRLGQRLLRAHQEAV